MAASDKQALQAALAALEARLADRPADIDLQVERAGLLATLEQTSLARERYLEILAQDPGHYDALNNFGALLHETGFRSAARTLFSEAVSRHPDQPLGHVNLANLLMYDDELARAREHYEIALRLDPGNAAAHQRLGLLLHELGEAEAAEHHRRIGFAAQPVTTYPYLGDADPVPLLVLTSSPAGDIAWAKLIDGQVFAVTALAAEFHDLRASLPPHRLIFNAIGDADLSRAALEAAKVLVARSNAPVVNHPTPVLATGRLANAERLGRLPGVMTPRALPLARGAFERGVAAEAFARAGLAFPLLLRSPGFHTGRHFVRVDQAGDLPGAAAALPGAGLMALQYLDARGADGLARKYRVMMIGGRLYPLHLAASSDWKVHYATGDMAGHEGLQAEEARFLNQMPDVVGARGMAALEAIQTELGLDYCGVDFALGAAGEILVFEANAVMNIIPPDASPHWNYRRPAIGRALDAARAMLVSKVGAHGH